MRAFTLVETLVSVAILSVFAIGIYAVLNTGEVAYHSDIGLLIVQQQARRGLDKMVRELRTASGPAISDAGGRITFDTEQGTDFSYYRDSETDRLMRAAGTPQPVASYITGLQFCCYHDGVPPTCTATCSGSTLVEISVTAGGRFGKNDATYSVKAQARMRNE